ncbi:MAG: hypothetical protein ABFS37_05450, partial [Acidobacteriota bacterium]
SGKRTERGRSAVVAHTVTLMRPRRPGIESRGGGADRVRDRDSVSKQVQVQVHPQRQMAAARPRQNSAS